MFKNSLITFSVFFMAASHASSNSILVDITNTITNTMEGDFHSYNGGNSTMKCGVNEVVGETENFEENWLFNLIDSSLVIYEPDYPNDTYVGSFNLSNQSVSFSEVSPPRYECCGAEGQGTDFYTIFDYSWSATFDEETKTFIGQGIEKRTLFWNLDERISECSFTFDMSVEVLNGSPPFDVNIPAMGGIGLLALGLSMLGLGAVRSRRRH